MDKTLVDFFTKKDLFKPENKSSVSEWILKAAIRANQLVMATHSGKYIHTSACKEASCIALSRPQAPDGYLRTGNCDVRYVDTLEKLDCLGNAAALDVYTFLSLVLEDGHTVFHHVQQRSRILQQELRLSDAEYQTACAGFMKIMPEAGYATTQDVMKQVYFPVGKDEYHLLSILTPSVLVSEMNKRISKIRFSDQAKEGREAKKNNEIHEGYDEVFDLTEMGYGGSNSQNAGVLNNRAGGVSLLLPSFPPVLHARAVRLPRRNFFNSLYVRDFADDFKALRDIIAAPDRNVEVRTRRDEIFGVIVDKIIQKSLAIRSYEGGWTKEEYYAQLPEYQKIWLDSLYAEERYTSEDWLERLIDEIGRWIFKALESFRPDSGIPLNDDDFLHIKSVVRDSEGGLL
ncbi:type I-F CRISPR-associated protein Csy1 [Parasphaerochaeta coccoides]|uniref:CRISPR-associated protein, Csy1 family n=1 Tax=Parasphaerochaeta coccoides (strain ATCC BAA-1237 / DSM 17374 / SPN1) TaxID=760011 RepID=F4GL29_PARC1|nr:type I-F CRISPR-associated protein Csy1 [Parasphaerochaeta coccoides]AEC02369.1 CRISPR-associated protein, Csy1 family [Parasphaerochaeta coccoides DSM 17374]